MPIPGNVANLPVIGPWLTMKDQNQNVIPGQQLGQMAQFQTIQNSMQEQQMRQQAMAEQQQIKGLVAQAGGDLAKTIQALLQSGNPKAIELASKLHSLIPKPQGRTVVTPGSTVLGPDDKPIYTATAKAEKPQDDWSEPYQLGGAMVQKNKTNGQVRTAVTREPNVRVTNEAPVTPVTIQDPDDPSGRGTVIIDGRTGKLIGKGPKMTQAGAIDAKSQLALTGLGADLQLAEDLLKGVVRTGDGQVVKGNLPTGSGIGSMYDSAAGFFGATPAGAAEADSLKTVAARLVSRVPRFEGPQSDKDVVSYKQAAGDAGNDKLPIPRRVAAVATMKRIYAGYESGEKGRLVGNSNPAQSPQQSSGKIGRNPSQMREFSTESDAIRSGVKGDVIIGGRKARID